MTAAEKVAPYTHLLGKIPDQEIAEKAGVGRTTVANLRRKQGILPFSKGHLANHHPKTQAKAKAISERDVSSPASSYSVETGVGTQVSAVSIRWDTTPEDVVSPALAVLVHDFRQDKHAQLEQVLVQSGFWSQLIELARHSAVEPADLKIVITPDFSLFDKDAPTGTDPELVEHLMELLCQQGYTGIVVGATPSSSDQWLENRDVLVLADMVGYQFITPGGYPYDVVDLSEDLIPVPFPEGSALHGTALSRVWVEAHFRINFAKNKTHEEYFYALGLHNLLSVLPLRDKHYHYRLRLKPWDVCLELLRQIPPQFTLIDAIASSHGSLGDRVPRPLQTNTLIAGRNLLLTDWVGAIKMGLDPYASPLNARALTQIGLPQPHVIVGDLTPYEGWINVPPVWIEMVRRVNDSPELSRVLQMAALPVNRELFPFKGEMGDRLNAFLSPLFTKVDTNPLAFWTALWVNYSGAATAQSLETWRTLFFKDQLHWQEVPLDLDLTPLQVTDYEAVVGYIEPLEALIQSTPADKNGLRWRYLEGSVLFKFGRILDAPFDELVQRVDITRSIQFMKDYIGGCCVPVAWDDQGRVTHQAERNIYLPQPNYLVLYGGKVIDVTKLEYIRYAPDQQKIYWRTLKSSNDSAEFDDGSVTFERVGDRQTLVTIVARQKFTLPLFWQAVNLDMNPPVKDFLVSDAYYTYFSETLNNFEAQYEGREFRIGQPWNVQKGEPGADISNSALLELATQAMHGVDALASRLKVGDWLKRGMGQPKPTAVDTDGFSHFQAASSQTKPSEGSQASPEGQPVMGFFRSLGAIADEFLTDLGKAVRKDMGQDSGE